MSSPKTVSVTPQEDRLLRAFRLLNHEYKLMMVHHAEMSADRESAKKPRLSLVVNEKRRATDKEASA